MLNVYILNILYKGYFVLGLMINIYKIIKSFGNNEEVEFIDLGNNNELDYDFIKPRPNFLKTIFDKK